MMRLKRKIPTFIFGVTVGLVVGAAFFVFKINDLFDKVKDSAREHITVIEQPVKNIPEQAEEKKKIREKFKINIGKSAKVNYHEVDSLIREDSNLNIATDELMSVKNVKVIRIGDNLSDGDTVAGKLANVSEVKPADLYFVEFWKTPLNSKGYRFTRNKIMLYGFVDFNDVLVYEVDKNYYIKCSGQVYRINYTSDFRKLERVMDSDLLAKIS
jgi:hypothetical protein